jgi:hypothetical protein
MTNANEKRDLRFLEEKRVAHFLLVNCPSWVIKTDTTATRTLITAAFDHGRMVKTYRVTGNEKDTFIVTQTR